jgi:hypothetical protein
VVDGLELVSVATRLPDRDDRPLSEVARHVVTPEGIASTGWPAVSAVLDVLGVVFDEWQVGLAKLVLAKDRQGVYAADTVAVSIPRQVGKTFTFGMILFALCLIRPGLTVLWTAHRQKTAGETFRAMKGMCQQPRLAVHILATPSNAENRGIEFRNGSRILFGARERGFGLGFSDVDVLLFDEAQRLTDVALDDMVPSTNAADPVPGPLVIYAGTPPRPTDAGAVFTEFRREALAGDAEGILFVEMSADEQNVDGSPVDPLDRKQWAKANPSYPRRTNDRSVLRMLKLLTAEAFRREALGIWDRGTGARVMPAWDQRADRSLRAAGRPDAGLVLGLAGSVDGAWGSIGAASVDEGRVIVGAVERREGQSWMVDEAARIQLELGCDVVIDGGGPLTHLIPELDEAGVRYVKLGTGEFLDGCAYVWDSVRDGNLSHPAHPDLDAAVRSASWRKVGARRAWNRETGDVSMLEAVTVAAQHARLGPGGFNIW